MGYSAQNLKIHLLQQHKNYFWYNYEMWPLCHMQPFYPVFLILCGTMLISCSHRHSFPKLKPALLLLVLLCWDIKLLPVPSAHRFLGAAHLNAEHLQSDVALNLKKFQPLPKLSRRQNVTWLLNLWGIIISKISSRLHFCSSLRCAEGMQNLGVYNFWLMHKAQRCSQL